MQSAKKDITGHAAAWFTMLLWGSTFTSTKVLLMSFTPVEILFCRFLMGWAALFIARPRLVKGLTRRQELLFAAAGFSGVTAHYLLENIALSYTTASNVGVLAAVAPLFTALFAFWFLKGSEKLRPTFFIGFAFAIAGIVLMSFNGAEGMQVSLKGDLLAILSAATWGVYAVLTRKISELGMDAIVMTRHIFGYGLIFMLPVLPIMGFSPEPALFFTPANAFTMCFLGLGASAACFATWNVAVRHLGAVKTSSYLYITPVISVVASAIVLGERLTPLALLGTALTLMGLILSEWKGKPAAK